MVAADGFTELDYSELALGPKLGLGPRQAHIAIFALDPANGECLNCRVCHSTLKLGGQGAAVRLMGRVKQASRRILDSSIS